MPHWTPLNNMHRIWLPQQAGPADATAMVAHSAQQPQAEPSQPLHSAAVVEQEDPPQQPAAPHKAVGAVGNLAWFAALPLAAAEE